MRALFINLAAIAGQSTGFVHPPFALTTKSHDVQRDIACHVMSPNLPTTDRVLALSPPQEGPSNLPSAASFQRVLDGLSDTDKYNAVVQGLATMAVSKQRGQSGQGNAVGEIFQLLDEMSSQNIKASLATCTGVVNAAAVRADIQLVASAMTKLRRTGTGQKFGRDMTQLSLLPSEPVRRQRALQELVPVPEDDRGEEVAYAGAFLGVVGCDLGADGLAPVLHWDSTLPTLLSVATAGVVAYDLLKSQGSWTRRIVAGLNRLFLRDVERECRAEAGAFLVAYLTGLPCFAFQPNVLEAVRMAQRPEFREALAGGNGVHRMLVWLLGPVAGEQLAHRQLIVSDPRQAYAFLQAARDSGLITDADSADDADRIQWAFNEARGLLKDNSQVYDALRQRLETGGASVGECVTVIERSKQ